MLVLIDACCKEWKSCSEHMKGIESFLLVPRFEFRGHGRMVDTDQVLGVVTELSSLHLEKHVAAGWLLSTPPFSAGYPP